MIGLRPDSAIDALKGKVEGMDYVPTEQQRLTSIGKGFDTLAWVSSYPCSARSFCTPISDAGVGPEWG